jgi:hypothetical protein
MKNDNNSGNVKITTTHNNRVDLLDARQKTVTATTKGSKPAL